MANGPLTAVMQCDSLNQKHKSQKWFSVQLSGYSPKRSLTWIAGQVCRKITQQNQNRWAVWQIKKYIFTQFTPLKSSNK